MLAFPPVAAVRLRWLEESSRIYSDYAIYWELRGEALEGMGQYNKAIESYLRMGQIYIPEDSDVPLRLGNLLLRQGRYSEAIQIFC